MAPSDSRDGDQPVARTRVRSEIRGRVAIVTLDGESTLNSLGWTSLDEASTALDVIERHRDVRSVIVHGSGRAFCSGGDLVNAEGAALEADTARGEVSAAQQIWEFHRRWNVDLLERLEAMAQITIAAIHGFCYGGGLELALACDIRIAERSSRIAEREASLGLIGATQRLSRLAPSHALDLLLTGREIDGDEAHRLGIVNRVVETDALAHAIELAEKISLGAPLANAATKRLVQMAPSLDLSSGLEAERNALARVFTSHDAREGVLAFAAKEEPRYRGY